MIRPEAMTPEELIQLRSRNLGRAGEFWGLARDIAAEFAVPVSAITAKTRGNVAVCEARGWLCLFAHDRGFSWPAIGRYIHRDHTSCKHAAETVGGGMDLVFRSARN